MTVSEVATEFGYCDVPSFSHAFVRWVGCSPGNSGTRRRATAPIGPAGEQYVVSVSSREAHGEVIDGRGAAYR